MELSVYLHGVRDNARQFVEAVRKAGVDAPVPTCPDWTVADLARHQGRVFYWMSAIVETKAQEYIDRTPFEEEAAVADPLTHVESGAEHALAVFGAADPETPVWNWLAGGPGPVRFWFRRMAHETVVHRADAEAAAAAPAAALSRVEPAELAADGIDEFLDFLGMRARGGRAPQLSGSYHFHTTDVPGEWVVVFDGDVVTIRREHAKADVAVRGPASDLELFLYSRRGSEGLETFGDPAAVAAWTEQIRF
jgi:uncharacterized protein (TIGR03083 family)